MSALRSLYAWSNPDWPSTPTYGAVARFGVRRGVLVTVFGAGQVAVFLAMGEYGLVAMLAGTLVASAAGYLAGAAVAFGDRWRAVLAGVASAVVLLATGVAMHALVSPAGRDLVVGSIAFAALGPLALGTLGYTAAERATWQTEGSVTHD